MIAGSRARAGWSSESAGDAVASRDRSHVESTRPRHPGRVRDFALPQYRERNARRTVFFDAGQGDAIVFLHGLGGNQTQWALVAPELAKSHRVLGVDLPGFGGTRRLRGRLTYDRLADEVFGLMDRRGVRRAYLVGHSFGGAVATHMALRAPERLRGLVLVSPAGFFRYPGWMRLGSRVLFNRAVFASSVCLSAPFIKELVCGGNYGPGVELFDDANWQTRHSLPFLMNFVHAVHALRPELVQVNYLQRLHEIKAPMHMVWGEDDLVLPSVQGLAAMEAAPRGAISRLPGVGHMPIFERPEAVIAAIRDVILRGQPPRALPALPERAWPGLEREVAPALESQVHLMHRNTADDSFGELSFSAAALCSSR